MGGWGKHHQIQAKQKTSREVRPGFTSVTTQLPGIYKEAKQRAGQQLWPRAADGSSSVRATASWNWDRNGGLQGKAVRANSQHTLLQGTTFFFFPFFPRG